MVGLLDLSAELLQAIFQEINPADLSSLSRSCKIINSFINPNRLLWRDVLLRHYDTPKEISVGKEPDWPSLLRSYVELQKIMESENLELKRSKYQALAATSLHLVASAYGKSDLSRNIDLLSKLFETQENRDVWLHSSSLYKDAGTESQWPAETEEDKQLSAQLHVYYGYPQDPRSLRGRRPTDRTHEYARARVYDLRHYNDRTAWGPFSGDGLMRVDWEKMEAIMIDLAHNLHKYSARVSEHVTLDWGEIFSGVAANSYTSLPLHDESETEHPMMAFTTGSIPADVAPLYEEPSIPLDARDPYGVTGTWRRVVCFLDYTDLYHINFESDAPSDLSIPREPIDNEEAIRLLSNKIRVTKITEPGEGDGKDYPVVHFSGRSRSLHANWDPNATSRIRGTVRQTPHGAIRWTSFSLYHGEERWRSECVQVGGIRSGRGILGTWFDKDYDEAGPAGPTAFWKLSDDIVEEKPRSSSHVLSGLVSQQHFWALNGAWSSSSSEEGEEDENGDEGEGHDHHDHNHHHHDHHGLALGYGDQDVDNVSGDH